MRTALDVQHIIKLHTTTVAALRLWSAPLTQSVRCFSPHSPCTVRSTSCTTDPTHIVIVTVHNTSVAPLRTCCAQTPLSLFPASSMCTECVLVRRRAQHTRRYAPAVLCTTQWTNAVHTSHLPLSTMYSSLRSEYIAVAVSSHGSLFSPTTDCPCNITSVASLRMFCALTTAMPILQFHVPFIFPHPHFVRMCYSIPRLWEGVANMT